MRETSTRGVSRDREQPIRFWGDQGYYSDSEACLRSASDPDLTDLDEIVFYNLVVKALSIKN